MKRIYLLVAAFLSLGTVASAQTIEGFDFEDKEVLFATPVKSHAVFLTSVLIRLIFLLSHQGV